MHNAENNSGSFFLVDFSLLQVIHMAAFYGSILLKVMFVCSILVDNFRSNFRSKSYKALMIWEVFVNEFEKALFNIRRVGLNHDNISFALCFVISVLVYIGWIRIRQVNIVMTALKRFIL